MIVILAVTRNAKVQCADTGRGYKGSVLEDWRYDKFGFLWLMRKLVFFEIEMNQVPFGYQESFPRDASTEETSLF